MPISLTKIESWQLVTLTVTRDLVGQRERETGQRDGTCDGRPSTVASNATEWWGRTGTGNEREQGVWSFEPHCIRVCVCARVEQG